MAVVEEVQMDGAVIRIHDDCCLNATEHEIQAILDRIASRALPALNGSQESKEKAG